MQTQSLPPNFASFFLDFFVWSIYNYKIMVLEIEQAFFILKMPVVIVMKIFFGGPSGRAKAVPDKYHGNGDFNSALPNRSYLVVRAGPVQADTNFTVPA
jgi:hypothetical protein